MKFDHRHYVPCMRWKLGEYQATHQLASATKDSITPLIEVPEIGFDFETRTPKKSVDDHLAPFAKRVRAKWQGRSCFVDVRLIHPSERMADDQHPVKFVFDELRSQKCLATPVIGLEPDEQYQQAVRQAVSQDRRGVCIRVSIEEADRANLTSLLDAVLDGIGVEVKKCHLVLDLRAPNFEPIEGFARVVEKIVRGLPYLRKWQTFTLIGTSFPSSMAEVKRSPAIIQRSEWLLYKKLIRSLVRSGVRLPTFGDYAINHPGTVPLDMRRVKPAATIRYTIDDAWLIIKGPNVRDYKFGQYRDHCRTLIASGYYLGVGFSEGDRYISDCALGVARTGNLSTWRQVGTNHHLEKVARDISSLFSSSGKSSLGDEAQLD